jgi:outer membrane lipoprotein SlyB
MFALVFGMAGLALLAGGCSSSSSSRPVYSAGQVNQIQTHELGTVVSVEAVTIERDTGQRTSVGQSVGSSVGRTIARGGDPVTAAAGAVGAVVGSVAGSSIERRVMRAEGQKIQVAMDDGTVISIVQENDPPFVGGERVRVVKTGSQARVELNQAVDGNNYVIGAAR